MKGEPSMILNFPDFPPTSEDFLISLTILQNSLTSGHPVCYSLNEPLDFATEQQKISTFVTTVKPV